MDATLILSRQPASGGADANHSRTGPTKARWQPAGYGADRRNENTPPIPERVSGFSFPAFSAARFSAVRFSRAVNWRFGFGKTSIFRNTSTRTGTTPALVISMRCAATRLRSMIRPLT